MNEKAQSLLSNLASVVVGNEKSIELLVATLISKGHVLLEDAPGLGKTVLARSLAGSIKSRFKRIQCTPDLLPSDVVGVSIFNEANRQFEFQPGPVFANIVLVDEINRTSPRTQSSLLEAMAEQQVSVDNKTYSLQAPFFVIATQNPIEYHGTYPLPEAQLDRFFMRLSLGYPDLDDEVQIMQMQRSSQHPLASLQPVLNADDILQMQEAVVQVHIEEKLLRYIAGIVQATREHPDLSYGASPRGSLALLRAAQALSYIRGSDFVTPDTIKSLVEPVLAHRVIAAGHLNQQSNVQTILREIVNAVAVPV